MAPALTATTWEQTLRYYRTNSSGPSSMFAAMLHDILCNVDDPRIAEILDAYGHKLLET